MKNVLIWADFALINTDVSNFNLKIVGTIHQGIKISSLHQYRFIHFKLQTIHWYSSYRTKPESPSSSSTSKRLSSPAAAVTGKSCSICLRHVDTKRAAVITACFHAFCHGCLLRWTHYKRRCPLCNADFTSFYSNLNHISSQTFRKHRLPPIHPPPSRSFSSGAESRHRPPLFNLRREIRRETVRGLSSRSRPLPRRRSFGWGENVTSDVIQYRILQWRASIYEQRLRAVPLPSRSFLHQNGVLGSAHKQRVIERLEPWIRRELRAILNDPDPTIIVHVATSIYVSSIEKSRMLPDSQDDLLNPLRRFLDGWTDMFWHELRCFADSGITMDTYDTVVEYKPIN